jgi:uncharacterized membrane protein
MNNQLRPLSLGEILDRTAELYRNNFLLFAGISAIFATAMLTIGMAHIGVLAALGYPNVAAGLSWSTAVAAVLEWLTIVLLAGLSVAANNRAVAWVYLGQQTTVRGAATSILPRVRSYLWLMTMAAFRAWAPLSALYVALFAIVFSILPKGFFTNPAVAQTAAPANPNAFIAAGIGMLILMPLFLAALVYGVWMSLRYSLAMPACVVEEVPPRQALRRSIDLSKGSRGRIFVLGLLVFAVRLLLGILLGFPFVAFAFKHPGHQIPLALLALQQVAGFLTNTFIGPIYSTGLTLFYYDQRVRKEGYDIEMMMQAAGLALPAEAPATQQP